MDWIFGLALVLIAFVAAVAGLLVVNALQTPPKRQTGSVFSDVAHPGEGGSGTVYLFDGEVLVAAGADLKRVHFIKLIRTDAKTRRQFLLAEDLDMPFVELSREIEKFAGCSINEIQALYGQNAYRRYERRALEEAIQIYPEVVIATPGGLVSDSANFNLLLSHCTTVWLQADAADHMGRVAAQGDMRPMAASREAMEDLKRILEGRSAFYSKADLAINTSGRSEDQAFDALRTSVRQHLALPA